MDKIYGRKPILETIDAGIKIHKAYIIKQNTPIVEKIIEKLRAKNVEIKFVNKDFFDKIDMNHQLSLIHI